MDGRRRVMLEREPRVFCTRCPVSWPGKETPQEAVRHAWEAHGLLIPDVGEALVCGARYGAGTGHPRRRPGRRKQPVTPKRTWGIE